MSTNPGNSPEALEILASRDLGNVPLPALPGTFGICHGAGWAAGVIRHATESWAGHAVMYVGDGKVVQAEYPKVQLADAPRSNVIWANGQLLSPDARAAITAKAHSLIGDAYDLWAYPILIAGIFYAGITKDAAPLFLSDKFLDCSAVVTACDAAAGIDLFPGTSVHFVTPAMLFDLAAQSGWLTMPAQETGDVGLF